MWNKNLNLYTDHLLPLRCFDDPGLSLTWLGAAGIYISDRKTGILIDPLVSRPGALRVAAGLRLFPNFKLIRHWISSLGAENAACIALGHSHYDHALDAPVFSRFTGATLLGSKNSCMIARGAGCNEKKIMEADPAASYRFGRFRLHFIPGVHGKAVFGRVPFRGAIDAPLRTPARASRYRLDVHYSILIEHPAGSIIHHGSAGFLPNMYSGLQADLILLCLAGRPDSGVYLEHTAVTARARRIIPFHFDNFFRPLSRPISFLPWIQFADFINHVKNHDTACTVHTLPLGSPVNPFIV